MPGDVTGSLVYDARTAEFEFRSGPVFTNLLLADEINRTPPKTQAALLEAMEERQVECRRPTSPAARPVHRGGHPEPDRVRGHLSAARGPTRPLPAEAHRAAAAKDQEIAILSRHAQGFDPRDLSAVRPVAGAAELAAGRDAVRQVLAGDEVLGYIVDIVGATRHSRRCSSVCHRAARRPCWPRQGRGPGCPAATMWTPDDVKAMARSTLRHRVALRPEAELEGATSDGVLDGILAAVPVPR